MPNQRSKSKGRKTGGSQTAIFHPPQMLATKRFSARARYLSSANGSTINITRGALLNHLVMNTASGTANYRLLSAFRLKSVEVWATAGTLGTTVTSQVEWLSTQGPSTVVSDTSVGTAQPSHIRSSPPASSLAGYWSISGSDEATILFSLTVPNGAIVDITYDAVVQNGETAVLATTTASGAIGNIYMTFLAGVTTTTFTPVSYFSLT